MCNVKHLQIAMINVRLVSSGRIVFFSIVRPTRHKFLPRLMRTHVVLKFKRFQQLKQV